MSAALEVAGLRVEGDTGVLLDIERLVVDAGSLAVITGPTDSGKTLLAAVLAGRAQASMGVAQLEGRQLVGRPSARRRLGIAVTIADGARISGCTVREALQLAGPRRAASALDRFALLGRRSRVPAELLSGGEQQLLQVVCAWCAAPRVLVLDAPTTGLAVEVAELVRQLARESAADGAAVLWLDQSESNAPGSARWRLDGGVLSAVSAAGSPTDRA